MDELTRVRPLGRPAEWDDANASVRSEAEDERRPRREQSHPLRQFIGFFARPANQKRLKLHSKLHFLKKQHGLCKSFDPTLENRRISLRASFCTQAQRIAQQGRRGKRRRTQCVETIAIAPLPAIETGMTVEMV